MIKNGRSALLLLTSLLILASCGGGGSSPSPTPTPTPTPTPIRATAPTYQAGVFQDSSTYGDICQVPRTGTNPATGSAFADMLGTTMHENMWMRSWTNELYLWYNEINYQDPTLFSDPIAYFDTLKTDAITPSGSAKDNFHFTVDTEEYFQLSQSGVSAGYGMRFKIFVQSANQPTPRNIVVTYVEPGSPAALAGVERGTNILSADGIDLQNSSDTVFTNSYNTVLYPASNGETHNFVVRAGGSPITSNISMTSEDVTISPVLMTSTIPSSTGDVGYIVFNRYIATAESALLAAFTQLESDNVSDLVLDMRYNGGGYLAIAAQLAYMISDTTLTDGKTFEQLSFNDKYPTTNPVTGAALDPIPFIPETVGFDTTAGQALPSLGLRRVFVLSSSSTCSASESVINGLRGAGIEVILIGNTTCGKPYGFYTEDNCGTTYFSIQFQGVNELGFGDYSDGFSPQNTISSTPGTLIPGCEVGDDLSHALGNPLESRLSAALNYRDNMTCPAPFTHSIISSAPISEAVSSSNAGSAVTSDAALPGRSKEAGQELILDENHLLNNRILGNPQ